MSGVSPSPAPCRLRAVRPSQRQEREPSGTPLASGVIDWLNYRFWNDDIEISDGTDEFRLAYDEELPAGDPARGDPWALVLRRQRDGALFSVDVEVTVTPRPAPPGEGGAGEGQEEVPGHG